VQSWVTTLIDSYNGWKLADDDVAQQGVDCSHSVVSTMDLASPPANLPVLSLLLGLRGPRSRDSWTSPRPVFGYSTVIAVPPLDSWRN